MRFGRHRDADWKIASGWGITRAEIVYFFSVTEDNVTRSLSAGCSREA
jgi:hypothetical protein